MRYGRAVVREPQGSPVYEGMAPVVQTCHRARSPPRRWLPGPRFREVHMQAKTAVKTDKPPTITREQLERRVDLLERVNRVAAMNAEQFSKHAAKMGALARAVRRSGVTLADRIAMVEAV